MVTTDRVDLHRVVLVQMERKVEELDTRVKELTFEVDNIDFEPVYQCDCSCDATISDLEDDLQAAYKRIEGLEQVLAEQQRTMELIVARMGL